MNNKLVGYRCRRGLLELDKILMPFYERHYQYLSDDEKLQFATILDQPDPVLLRWFFQIGSDQDSPQIIKLILRLLHKV